MAHSSESHGTYDLKDTPPPAWAMEKAREVVLTLCPDMDQRLQRKIDEIPLAKAITRALVAEYERGFTDGRDDVAVERRERDAYARGVKEEREAATLRRSPWKPGSVPT